MSTISEYFQALERLVAGKPKLVPKGTLISNDSVSLEAGRGKGSIKKSREGFAQLLEAIAVASAEQNKLKVYEAERLNKAKGKIESLKDEATQLREQLDAALAREMSLVYELFETKKKLMKLTGEKVVPIKKDAKSKNDADRLFN